MLFIPFLLVGILAGFAGSVFPQISGLLMSLVLPLGMLDWSAGVAFITAYRGVVGITQYLDNLGQTEVNRKSLSQKGKQLQVSYGAANQYFQIKLLASLIACVFAIVVTAGDILPSAGIILPISVFCTGIGWSIYIIKKKTQAPLYIAIVVIMALLALFTIKSGMVQGTMILMFGLYSLKGLIHQLQGAIPPQKEGIMECKSITWWLSILNGLLSSTAIGFSGIKIYDGKNEVKSTYEGAIQDGIADVLGLLLFFLQGSSRDMTTTFLGLALNSTGLVTLPLGAFVWVALISIAVSMGALASFHRIAKCKIHFHNSSGLRPYVNAISIVINVCGLTIIAGSFWGVIGVLCVGLVINLLMQEWKIHPEFSSVLLTVLPALALFGLV